MKVDEVLGISVDTKLTESFDFNDLQSLHIAALRAINDGRMDVENASDRMLDILYELTHHGLIDNNFNLTDAGKKAVELATTLGGSKERRRAAAQKNVDIDDIYGDSPNNDYDDGNDDFDLSPYSPNRFGSINQNY